MLYIVDSYRILYMIVDTYNPTGTTEFDEQASRNHDAKTSVTFRVKVKELAFLDRMADVFWNGGLIPEPTLRALTRASLNIVVGIWSKLEEENYNHYIGRLAEAEALSRQPANPCISNPPYIGSIVASPDLQPVRKPAFIFGGMIPPHLTRGPPIEKIEAPWF
jgi:hypothetical protein